VGGVIRVLSEDCEEEANVPAMKCLVNDDVFNVVFGQEMTFCRQKQCVTKEAYAAADLDLESEVR